MRKIFVVVAAAMALLSPTALVAQGPTGVEPAEPFKVGTFNIHGVPHVGIVLRDSLVIDIEVANMALESNPEYPKVPMPEDMLELIGRYDYGLKYRLYEIVNDAVGNNRLSGSSRADYVYDVSALRIRPPIMYPGKMMNAAVNFYSHACEGCSAEELAQRTQARQEDRGVPYLFLKPARGAVIGSGDQVVMPYGRDRIEWEVELAIVMGRTGKYISSTRAYDHVFGYMVAMDISDRGGRPPGGYGSGSDWFVGKGHDTFAPQGPWIVPKEFYGDPMEKLHQTLVIDGVTVQEARAGDMIHNIPELIEYASSLITLFPGDVLQSGTSGGTGAGRVERATGSGYLQAGETITASIEGIGTLTHEVVAEESIPDDLSGAQLPPTSTYRD
jgi:2-keto-4-pentenoate hydratase/2-oxohepta-3-ene-1,7-dioic acid hydratase in catechol pathway